MKKIISLTMILVLLLALTCPALAIADLTPGTYTLTTYEVGDMTMDGSMMPDTWLTVNGNGTGVFCIQGVQTEITYDFGTICVGGSPTYYYGITGETTVRINIFDTLYLNMTYAGEDAAPASAPASLLADEPTATAAPTAAPASGVTIGLSGFSGAKSIIISRGSSGQRDGTWYDIANLDLRATSFTDNTPDDSAPFYKVTVRFSEITEVYIYRRSDIQEKWIYNANGQILSGRDYVGEISYEYVYDRGVYTYRKKTYENLQAGEDYTYDSEVSKISSGRSTATTYAITFNRSYEEAIAIGFEFQLTQITQGSPFGRWHVYVRLSTNNNWREAAAYTVADGQKIVINQPLDNPFSIYKIAFVGPPVTFSCNTTKVITSITVKDYNY